MIDRVGLIPKTPGAEAVRPHTAPQQTRGRFADLLAQELRAAAPVKFSAHAQQRLEARGIQLSEAQQARLDAAVQQAASKGGRESLVLLDDMALVVSVPNRTVITALATGEASDQVFTNIDSAVLAAVPSDASKPTNHQTSGLDPLLGSPAAADRSTRPQPGDF